MTIGVITSSLYSYLDMCALYARGEQRVKYPMYELNITIFSVNSVLHLIFTLIQNETPFIRVEWHLLCCIPDLWINFSGYVIHGCINILCDRLHEKVHVSKFLLIFLIPLKSCKQHLKLYFQHTLS